MSENALDRLRQKSWQVAGDHAAVTVGGQREIGRQSMQEYARAGGVERRRSSREQCGDDPGQDISRPGCGQQWIAGLIDCKFTARV